MTSVDKYDLGLSMYIPFSSINKGPLIFVSGELGYFVQKVYFSVSEIFFFYQYLYIYGKDDLLKH